MTGPDGLLLPESPGVRSGRSGSPQDSPYTTQLVRLGAPTCRPAPNRPLAAKRLDVPKPHERGVLAVRDRSSPRRISATHPLAAAIEGRWFTTDEGRGGRGGVRTRSGDRLNEQGAHPIGQTPEMINFQLWVSTTTQQPASDLTAGWENVGGVDTSAESDLQRYLQGLLGIRANPTARSVKFWAQAWSTDWYDALSASAPSQGGPRRWIALSYTGPTATPFTFFSTGLATRTLIPRRAPEKHPGDLTCWTPVALKVAAAQYAAVFNRVPTMSSADRHA